MAQKLAIDKTKIHEYEPLAGCQSYTNYLTKLAVYHTVIEGLNSGKLFFNNKLF